MLEHFPGKQRLLAFLRKTERFTKTDNVYLAKNGFELLIVTASSLLNGVIIYVLLGRLIPRDVFGVYKYYLSLYGLFSLATLTGIDTALNRSAARNHDGSLAVAFKRKFFAGVIGSVGFLAASGWYFLHANTDLGSGMLLIAALAPIIYATSVYGPYLMGKRLFSTYRQVSLGVNLLSFAILVGGIFFAPTALWLFFAYLLANLSNIVGYLIARRHVTNASTDAELVSYGQHLSLLDVVATIAAQADSLLIFHLLGPIQLAVYSMANLPADQIKGILKTGQALAFPKFAEQNHHKAIKHLLRKAWTAAAMSAVAVGAYVIAAPFLFGYLFPAYSHSVAYTQVLAASVVLAMPASLIVTYFYAQGLRKEIATFTLFNSLLLIALDGIGVYLWGIWGIVLALLVNRACNLGFCVWRVRKLSKAVPVTTPE